jgi:tetratricopeptide (TPR) repeat protein
MPLPTTGRKPPRGPRSETTYGPAPKRVLSFLANDKDCFRFVNGAPMSRKVLERARTPLLALTVVAALMASTSARSGQNEDWCFADQEKTPDEALAGCTALIDGGKLSKDKLATAYANRCLVHTQRMASDLAIADCTQAIAIDAKNADTYAQRGEAYCQEGDIAKCVADFDEAMRIDPDDPSFTYLRGAARADAGDADGAITDLTKAIDKDPGSVPAYVRRGRIYEAEGDKARAAADYRKALEIDPYEETAKQHLEAFSK